MIVVSGDVAGVVVIDTAALARTPLGRRYAARFRSMVDDNGKLAELCGIDISTALEKLWISVPRPGARGGGVAFRGALDRPALEACIRRMGEAEGKTVEITAEGRIAVIRKTGEEPTHAAWLDDKTFVVPMPASDRAALDRLLAASPTPPAALAPFVERADKTASMWVALVGDLMGSESAALLGSAPLGAHASVRYTQSLHATAGIGFGDAAAAGAAVATVNEQFAQLKANPAAAMLQDLLNTVTIAVKDVEMVIEVELDANQVDKLADIVELML